MALSWLRVFKDFGLSEFMCHKSQMQAVPSEELVAMILLFSGLTYMVLILSSCKFQDDGDFRAFRSHTLTLCPSLVYKDFVSCGLRDIEHAVYSLKYTKSNISFSTCVNLISPPQQELNICMHYIHKSTQCTTYDCFHILHKYAMIHNFFDGTRTSL